MQDSFCHTMSAEAWQHLEQLGRDAGLTDAEMAGLAIGCPWHGNASMDFDSDGVFCHRCEAGVFHSPGTPCLVHMTGTPATDCRWCAES